MNLKPPLRTANPHKSDTDIVVTQRCTLRGPDHAHTSWQQPARRSHLRAHHVRLRNLASLGLLPGLHLLVGHDHTEYQWKHLAHYLSKGSLTEDERHALSQYQSSLFDGDETLRASAMPRFVRGSDAGPVGTVSEPPPKWGESPKEMRVAST